jgi:type I restriction enzyme S subunit
MRKEKVSRSKLKFSELQPLSIHFDGSVSKREVAPGREYTMELWFARPGDIVVAKIDLKNGAVGIVPEDWENVVVTGHFAVYEADRTRLLPEFFQRLIQTSFFKTHLWRNKVGAEGRKEVKLDFFESQLIPLPPVAEQRAIVERWRSAQSQIAAASVRVEKVSGRIDYDCYAAIGFKIAERKTPPKVFAAPWAGFGRWSVSFNQQTLTGMNLEAGKYPLATLDSLLTLVQYGTSEKANEQGRGVPVLRIGNIKDRVVDMTNLKHIELPPKTVESLTLKDGDMLIIRTSGSRDLVGTCAVFHGSEQAVFASYLIRLRFDTTRANPDYVCWFLNSALGRQQVDSISRQIMQNNINSEEIRTLCIPLPPLEIQHKLVERVTAARVEIARERAAATQLRQTTAAEVESLILGTKPPPKP